MGRGVHGRRISLKSLRDLAERRRAVISRYKAPTQYPGNCRFPAAALEFRAALWLGALPRNHLHYQVSNGARYLVCRVHRNSTVGGGQRVLVAVSYQIGEGQIGVEAWEPPEKA